MKILYFENKIMIYNIVARFALRFLILASNLMDI